MIKKPITLLLLLTFSICALSQDIIYKTDGSKLYTKIIDHKGDTIFYKSYDNQAGPTYIILKLDIKMINKSDGQTEIITPEKKPVSTTEVRKAAIKERIFFYGSRFYYKDQKIPIKDVYNIFEKRDCSDLIKKLKSGTRLREAGNTCIFAGFQTMIIGIVGYTSPDGPLPGLITFIAGGVSFTSGFILRKAGKHASSAACAKYNDRILEKASINLDFGRTPHGVGLIMNF